MIYGFCTVLAGCYYYTFADGSPSLIPSACAAHAAADPSSLAPAPAAAPLAAAASPATAPFLYEPIGPREAARAPARVVITEEDLLAEVGELVGVELELEQAKDGAGGMQDHDRRRVIVSEGDMLELLTHSPSAEMDAKADV
jgi:hypothetical protein